MTDSELGTFIDKFSRLWKAGLDAHLDIESHAGHAWVGLRVRLGYEPGPPQHQPQSSCVKKPRDAPSRKRCRDRRAAERAVQAQAGNKETIEVVSEAAQAGQEEPGQETFDDADDSTGNVEHAIEGTLENVSGSDTSTEEVDSTEHNTNENDAEKVDDLFPCVICDFKSNWANGLSIHMTRKHPNLEQLDGSNSVMEDLDVDEKYHSTKHYWEKGKLGKVYQTFLDANDIIESSDLNEECKQMERNKVLEARKCSFGGSYIYFLPWI